MDPSLLLAAREPLFHRSEHGVTRDDFECMAEPDFWEIGASSARYSRAFVLDELDRRRAADGWKIGFHQGTLVQAAGS